MSTYVANTPLQTDSPGIFPAQANQNFIRLQTLLGADHQFNNSALSNDGYHNLIHMTEQVPVAPIAGVGQLYAKSASGVTQLFYTDSAGTEHQITPESSVSSTLITGNAMINTGGPSAFLAFANPGYNYTAIAQVYINASSFITTESLLLTGAANNVSALGPAMAFGCAYNINVLSPGDLYITNFTGSTHTFYWTISICRSP